MFLAHFGVAMAAKSVAPRPSLGTLVLAAQLVDCVWPVFLLLGIEQVRISPGITVVTPLDFVSYPYTHSLVAGLTWAAAIACGYWWLRRDNRGAGCLAALVLSHWMLDALSHRPDVPTWPGGPVIGARLWDSLPATLVVEFALFGAGAWIYARVTHPRDRLGSVLLWAFFVTLVFLYFAAVFGPPPSDVPAVAIGALAVWLFVAWAYWIDRHRVPLAAI
jgi:hypothetical protein